MNKSIYEEAIELIENIDRNLPYTWLVGRDNLIKIKQTLKQAQKQEKLLELYRKLSVIRNDLLSYCEVVDDDYDDFEYIETDLEKQIKEIENENNR